jgi:hypothetical protein
MFLTTSRHMLNLHRRTIGGVSQTKGTLMSARLVQRSDKVSERGGYAHRSCQPQSRLGAAWPQDHRWHSLKTG